MLQNQYLRIQRWLFGLSLAGLAVYFIAMAFLSQGVLEPGDGIVHYNMAKYAPKYPELFLNHWGKPLFTILSSVFAQMGFPGMIVFNVILFCVASLFIYLWAEKRKNPFAWLSPLLLVSSYVYFDMVNAGMTEILFATILTATVYFFFGEKYILGSIIFSFALFSRPEANIILPIFFLFLLWKKQWKAVPFLATGFVLFSIIGYFHYKDLLWYFHKDPYQLVVPFYGHGELLHFVRNLQPICGPVLLLFSLIGVVGLLVALFTKNRSKAIDYLWLAVVPSIAVIFVHSYIWWKGIHASIGLIRVMATIMPLLVILSLVVLNYLFYCLQKRMDSYRQKTVLMVLPIILFILIMGNIRFSILPVKESPIQILLSEAAQWYLEQHNNKKLYYSDPYFGFKAKVDPYNLGMAEAMYYTLDKNDPSINLQSGDIIMWEAHFGPTEAMLAKEKLTENPNFEILKTFIPKERILVLHDRPYEIVIARVK